MRQRLGIIITIVLVIGALVIINTASYVAKDEPVDSELAPNRSTYHSGPTGTRALYDFLNESGYQVMRWREIPERLLSDEQRSVKTFVIIGRTSLPIDEDQAEGLLFWVLEGGRLVLVDREPDDSLLPQSGDWTVSWEFGPFPPLTTDPGDPVEMTENVKPVVPGQPTLLTQNIESVMPSRFASTLGFTASESEDRDGGEQPEPVPAVRDPAAQEFEDQNPTDAETESAEDSESSYSSPAPVAHLSNATGALLLDYQYGDGRIVVLSDPYMLSNGGIGLNDNLQLAINILGGHGGLIAFDEYHQGKAIARNELIAYFSGTPIIAIAGQITLLILLVLWSRGRRFARPLPLAQIDRRSSLEFVASMAELQQRAGAFDLAIENIYARIRRLLARYAGTDYNTPRSEIAARVAARSSLDSRQLEVLMKQCEDAINGAPLSERQSIRLAKRLRDIEAQLGLRIRPREARQAAQKA